MKSMSVREGDAEDLRCMQLPKVLERATREGSELLANSKEFLIQCILNARFK